MRVLIELPAPTRRKAEKYPWTEWFDGTPRLFEQGVDYEGTTAGFRSCAYAAARRHAVKIMVRTIGDDLAVQAVRS